LPANEPIDQSLRDIHPLGELNMGLNHADLDDVTRQQMLAEFDSELEADTLYISNYLSATGRERYPGLLREAIEDGDDDSLATALAAPGIFDTHHQRRNPKGGFTRAKVPHTANATLAEGEFNRFYLRGLCLRAIAEGVTEIEIYRARTSSHPRPESRAMIGRRLDADELLADLRANDFVDTALRLPPGPNSGLSGRISGEGSSPEN
jgi:hypothetical protein